MTLQDMEKEGTPQFIAEDSGKMVCSLYSSGKYLTPPAIFYVTRARSDQKCSIAAISMLEQPFSLY